MTYDFWFVNHGHEWGCLKATRRFGKAAWDEGHRAGRAKAEAEIKQLQVAFAKVFVIAAGSIEKVDDPAWQEATAAIAKIGQPEAKEADK